MNSPRVAKRNEKLKQEVLKEFSRSLPGLMFIIKA